LARVRLQVCATCALIEPYIRASLERLSAAHRDAVEIVPEKCLDVCEKLGALKLGEEVLLLAEAEIHTLEEKVAAALQGEEPAG
jgi:hypothetical protein